MKTTTSLRMQHTSDLTDFIKQYDDQISKIIMTRFFGIVTSDNRDEIKQDFYVTMHRRNILGRYDPQRGAAFSSYIFRCVGNHILAYRYKYGHQSSDALSHCADLKTYDDQKEDVLDGVSSDPRYESPETALIHGIDLSSAERRLQKQTMTSRNTKRANRTSGYLFQKYKQGWTDREIAEDLGITVAGVGAIKRKLRRELAFVHSG